LRFRNWCSQVSGRIFLLFSFSLLLRSFFLSSSSIFCFLSLTDGCTLWLKSEREKMAQPQNMESQVQVVSPFQLKRQMMEGSVSTPPEEYTIKSRKPKKRKTELENIPVLFPLTEELINMWETNRTVSLPDVTLSPDLLSHIYPSPSRTTCWRKRTLMRGICMKFILLRTQRCAPTQIAKTSLGTSQKYLSMSWWSTSVSSL